jgi:hypothetical protein
MDVGFDLDPNFNGIMSALSLPGFVTSWLKKEGECMTTYLDEPSGHDLFSVYPNPANGNVTIHINEYAGSKTQLKLYDSMSRLVKQEFMISSSHTLNTQGLQPGLYFLLIENPVTKYPAQKLILY